MNLDCLNGLFKKLSLISKLGFTLVALGNEILLAEAVGATIYFMSANFCRILYEIKKDFFLCPYLDTNYLL